MIDIGEEENFKLLVTRFYGKDRLAETVILRSRKGDVFNLKSEWRIPLSFKLEDKSKEGYDWPKAIVTFLNPMGFQSYVSRIQYCWHISFIYLIQICS